MANFGDIKPDGPLGYEWEEINRLRKVNAALLEALERIAKWSEDTDRYATATLERMVATAGKRARAAIAQAKGEK